MAGLTLDNVPRGGQILMLGAHCDDIEIGCGATLSRLVAHRPDLEFRAIIFCSDDQRETESRESLKSLLDDHPHMTLEFGGLRDGYLPFNATESKEFLVAKAGSRAPALIFSHHKHDLHQDHRFVAELTYQVFRNSMILEMEIPKYDGDMGRPNVYFPVDDEHAAKKISTLLRYYPSQATKDWFSEETFAALMRIRGIECRSPSGKAEAFYSSKLIVS